MWIEEYSALGDALRSDLLWEAKIIALFANQKKLFGDIFYHTDGESSTI